MSSPPTSDPAINDPVRPPGAMEPLRDPTFRTIWSANMVSNIGTWMQTVGASWEMTHLAPSPIFVALMATANTLPVFLFSLSAGVLADTFDRRIYIICCQLWMMAAAVALAVLAAMGGLTAWNLLILTFVLGIGNAMNGPGWQSAVPEIVGKRLLAPAVALNSAGFNVARSIGPGIGGLLYAALGTVALFAVNAVTFLAVVLALLRWRRPPPEEAPRHNNFLAGMAEGLAYLRGARDMHRIFVRSILFFIPAAGLMAMLPLIASEMLHLDATGFGIIYSAFGAGAVLGAFVLPLLRRWAGQRWMVPVAMSWFSAGMCVVAAVPVETVVGVAVALAGVGWICVHASNNVAAQMALPFWVRARGIAAYQMSFFGSLALGGALWGKVAEMVGVAWTVGACGILMAVATLLVVRLEARPLAAAA